MLTLDSSARLIRLDQTRVDVRERSCVLYVGSLHVDLHTEWAGEKGRAERKKESMDPGAALAICKKAKSKVKTVLAVQNDRVRDHGPMPVVSSSRSILECRRHT